MSVDLFPQKVCVGIVGDSAWIHVSRRRREEELRCKCEKDVNMDCSNILTNLMALPMKRTSVLFSSEQSWSPYLVRILALTFSSKSFNVEIESMATNPSQDL